MRTLFVFLLLMTALPAAAVPKHLVVLAIDTLRADRLGCYGHDVATSPNIDRLAQEGVRFERAIAPSPWTLPSFATMFTGLHPTRHGAGMRGELRDLSQERPHPIAPQIPTLGELLRERGFATAAFTTNPYLLLGIQRGFDEFFCRAIDAERVGSFARAWIEGHDPDEPAFLFVHFNDPHEPTDAPDILLRTLGLDEGVIDHPRRGPLERWGDAEFHLGRETRADDELIVKRALYDATIRQVDLEIGRIVDALALRGMLDDTLIVLTSDHGEEFHEHVQEGRARAEDPRDFYGIGHGHALYDEVLHVPLILRGPSVPVGSVIAEQFPLVDLMPTMLGVLGYDSDSSLDGRDRNAWIHDDARAELGAFAESIAYGRDHAAWIEGGKKVVFERSGAGWAVFDLLRDPLERRDLLSLGLGATELAEGVALRDSLRALAPPDLDAAELSPEMIEGLRTLGYVD